MQWKTFYIQSCLGISHSPLCSVSTTNYYCLNYCLSKMAKKPPNPTSSMDAKQEICAVIRSNLNSHLFFFRIGNCYHNQNTCRTQMQFFVILCCTGTSYLPQQQNPVTLSVSETSHLLLQNNKPGLVKMHWQQESVCIHILLTLAFPMLPTLVRNYNKADTAAKTHLELLFKILHGLFWNHPVNTNHFW